MRRTASNSQVPYISEKIMRILFPDSGHFSTIGDLEEVFLFISEKEGVNKARRWYRLQLLKAIPAFINRVFYWLGLFLSENLKISYRTLLRNKYYSAINIAGLTTGLTCSILILLFANNELTYDNFHKDADRIYRVAKVQRSETTTERFAANHFLTTTLLKKHFAEIENIGIAGTTGEVHVYSGNNCYLEKKLIYADPGLLDIFSIPYIIGNPKTALAKPRSLLLSKSSSYKYFGMINPLGNTLKIDSLEYTITGVIEDAPANTHLKYNMIRSLEIENFGETKIKDWNGPHCQNYIKLKKGIASKEFESKIAGFYNKYSSGSLKKSGLDITLFLQPIEDIHLYSDLQWETEQSGNISYVYILACTGAFVLLLSCMNFINITTARLFVRYKEFGVRKIIGANRKHLVGQLFTEVFLVLSVSMVMSLVLAYLLLPLWSGIIHVQFNPGSLFNTSFPLLVMVLGILTLLVIGFYPAMYLSSVKIVQVISNNRRFVFNNPVVRTSLVVMQFAIAIALISGTYILSQQINFMKDKYPGFSKEQKVVLEFDRVQFNHASYKEVKKEFLKNNNIKGATFSSSVPGRWLYYWSMFTEHDGNRISCMCNVLQADTAFIKEYDLELIAGRNFADELDYGWIINEEAVKAFGWKTPESALGQFINFNIAKVIGVVKNFNFEGLQKPVGPLLIFVLREDFRYLTLRISTQNLAPTLGNIENTYNKLRANNSYRYFILKEDFNKQYEAEESIAALTTGFTSAGIIVAFMGLFGLTTFLAEKRTKELGVRKVMGASTFSLVFLLAREFILWLFLGLVLAVPVSYRVMNLILSEFAYRIQIDSEPFIVSALSSLLIIILTIGVQAFKIANVSPVISLRSE